MKYPNAVLVRPGEYVLPVSDPARQVPGTFEWHSRRVSLDNLLDPDELDDVIHSTLDAIVGVYYRTNEDFYAGWVHHKMDECDAIRRLHEAILEVYELGVCELKPGWQEEADKRCPGWRIRSGVEVCSKCYERHAGKDECHA